jgi:signal transduction histidine kinase
MNFLAGVQARAAASVRRIAFAESADERTRQAIGELARRRVVQPVVVLDPRAPETHDEVRRLGVEVRDPIAEPLAAAAADRLFEARRGKGLTKQESIELLHTPLFFADALVAAVERKTSLVLHEESLDDFVKECCTEIKVLLKTTQIQLSSDLHCNALVRVDKDKLRRAILNLAANAREALKGEGEIRLKTESIESQAVIHVEDTGSGIPADQLRLIFDKFYSTKTADSQGQGGSGIGDPRQPARERRDRRTSCRTGDSDSL